MLRRADNVSLDHKRGFFTNRGPITIKIGRSQYISFPKASVDEYDDLIFGSDQYPTAFVRVGPRRYWLFQQLWYWEDTGLNSDEIYALLVTRQQRDTVRVRRAQQIVSMQQSPVSTARGAIPEDVKHYIWTRDQGLHGTLSGLFGYLIGQGTLTVDPLTAAGLERPKVGRRLPRYIDKPSEFANVITTAATPDPAARDPWPERDLALAAVLAGTAARAGEICTLTIGDLVLDGEEPYIRVLGKGSVTRDCPLAADLVAILRTYLHTRAERTGKPTKKTESLFLNGHLDAMSTAVLDHHVRRWFTRAGVPLPPGAAAHAFRHTVAMQLIGLGESATVVQDLLGHASLSSTQIYTKAAGRHIRAAAGALPLHQVVRDLPTQ